MRRVRGSQETAPGGAGRGLDSGRADPLPSADGKLYDAYVSYSDSPDDRKFVNFILKPQLERCRGYKLFLDDRDLLPRAGAAALGSLPLRRGRGPRPRPRPPASVGGPLHAPFLNPGHARLASDPRRPVGPSPSPVPAEPSADLLVNLSRCRRLIVVLSDAFLGRPWCSHSFRWVWRWGPGRGVVARCDLLTAPRPQGGPVSAAGAHAQTHLHHLRRPTARPRAPRAAPAAPAPPPGDPVALAARLRGAEWGGRGTGSEGRGFRGRCPRSLR